MTKSLCNGKTFVAFILSHGRANNVKTYNALRTYGYTGDIVIVCDNEDKESDEYRKRFGADNVVVFDKQAEIDAVDTYMNNPKRGVILYARNACFRIAEKLGYERFVELDDDYHEFHYRWISSSKVRSMPTKNLDGLFSAMIEMLDNTRAKTVSLAQGGDFVGGINGPALARAKRKAMNSFFCDTSRPFSFLGAINEDVNMYTLAGIRGELVFQTMRAQLEQGITQKNKGGMTEEYLDSGTFVKSMFSVISAPSSVRISVLSSSKTQQAENASYKQHPRIHHNVNWSNCAAKIVAAKWKVGTPEWKREFSK